MIIASKRFMWLSAFSRSDYTTLFKQINDATSLRVASAQSPLEHRN
jgi:hypothetical protein